MVTSFNYDGLTISNYDSSYLKIKRLKNLFLRDCAG